MELWNVQTWTGRKFRLWMEEGADHDTAWKAAEEMVALHESKLDEFSRKPWRDDITGRMVCKRSPDFVVMVTMAALTQFNDAPMVEGK